MANFRVYPGLFVRIIQDHENLKKGQQLQILSTRYRLSSIGVNGSYEIKNAGSWLEPVIKEK